MDLASLIGIFGAFGMVVFSVLVGGGSLVTILDLPSFLMVVLGSFFALMITSSLAEALGIFTVVKRVFNVPVFNEAGIIQKMMSLSEKARREGLLALEDEIGDLEDEFMRKGLQLVVDGTDAAVIRDLMELELSQMQSRHADKIGFVNVWAALAPGFGMMGTVIGLIGMLQNLEDKARIGPNMALALITTLYGSMMANMLLMPISTKLKGHDARESLVKEMVIEGVASIQAGDNTRILAMKLLAYVNPLQRKALEAEVLKD
jgi:chemotaxis protein MotA